MYTKINTLIPYHFRISMYQTLSGTTLIHQVPKKDSTSYRFMSNPPKKQPLQLLYPGRLLTPYDDFNGTNIQHLYPEAIEKTRSNYQKIALEANQRQQSLKTYLGGDGRLLAHPFVEPDVMVDDPVLGIMSLSTPSASDTGAMNRGPSSQFNSKIGTPPLARPRN